MSVEQLEELVEVALPVESLDEFMHRLSTESENEREDVSAAEMVSPLKRNLCRGDSFLAGSG
jgi:hypothetical protein